MRYELRSNTTPVATTDSAGGKRVCERREPPQRTGSSTIPNFVQKSNSNPIEQKWIASLRLCQLKDVYSFFQAQSD
ncbi:MAG: hypothetical protein V7K72_17975 [Nostoc sp.]|uniref:hypothetical protein n=1 Tax=Nostoc sp. TaxID=1180 RepID=UPI002FFA6777